MNNMLLAIVVPIVAGAITLFIPKRIKYLKEGLALIVTALVLILAVMLFAQRPQSLVMWGILLLRMDNLSAFVTLFVAIFGFLLTVYSLSFMKGRDDLNQYYAYFLMTIGGSIGAVLANNFIFFVTCWGFLGITLYLLINLGKPDPSYVSKKTLIIVGGSDALMLLGVGIVWHLSRTFSMANMTIHLTSGLAVLAFICLACGAFAKAGAMPLHTWIPDSSQVAPLPVMALLPASLDKLLGIYFLARLSMDIFIVKSYSTISIFLLVIGSITILGAVFMALAQHDFKKLLAYHSVSQVGYMILGIGTGNPIGIAGGLFHMLNNSIYKTCLFLCGGAVEHEKKTTDLDKLGGLSKVMPITYISCLVAALAISGIPPLNGFVSKWMVYQGIIELGSTGAKSWVIWLVAAIFGSALTLASFMKLIHATFLGVCPGQECKRKEVAPTMWVPMAILAFLCIVFGVFAYQIPIKLFIQPSILSRIHYPGVWDPTLSTGLILVGIVIGVIVYAMGNMKNLRVDDPFIGGELMTDDMKVSGVAFYKTIEELPLLAKFYAWSKKGYFDIYNVGTKLVFVFTRRFQALHNGILPSYLAWCLVGAIVLFFVLR